jgi:hypothetical protein
MTGRAPCLSSTAAASVDGDRRVHVCMPSRNLIPECGYADPMPCNQVASKRNPVQESRRYGPARSFLFLRQGPSRRLREQRRGQHRQPSIHIYAELQRRHPISGIEITCGTQFSVTHAAPPDASLPAVFLHWRFAYAGTRCARRHHHGPASANLHILNRIGLSAPTGGLHLDCLAV